MRDVGPIFGWISLLFLLSWYPYDFSIPTESFDPKFGFLSSPALASHFDETRFAGWLNALRHVSLFVPLVLMAAKSRHAWSISIWLTLFVGAMIEAGRLFLPANEFDVGNIALALLASLLLLARPSERLASRSEQHCQPSSPSWYDWRKFGGFAGSLLATSLACGVVFEFAISLPSVPYNIPELVPKTVPPWVTGAVLTLIFGGLIGGPVILMRWSKRADRIGSSWNVMLVIVPLTALTWSLLHAAVPTEAMHDIVGSPILNWPWHFEEAMRFVVLVLPIVTTQTVLAFVFANSRMQTLSNIQGVLPLVISFAISHVLVVVMASTDNLVELMRDGGNVRSSICLGLWLLVTFGSVHFAARHLLRSTVQTQLCAVFGMLLSIPVGLALLDAALVPSLRKYQYEHSALQFLLSPSRDHLIGETAIIVRYVAAHVGVLTVGFLVCWPAYAGFRKPPLPQSQTTFEVSANGDRGQYVILRIPPDVLSKIERLAESVGNSEAATIRGLVAKAIHTARSGDSRNLENPQPDEAQRARATPIEYWITEDDLAMLRPLMTDIPTYLEAAITTFVKQAHH